MLRALLGRLTRGIPIGRRGEQFAARHLKQQGYRILTTNARDRGGEIDLVALAPDGRTLVIVEVKAGTGGTVRPEVHVNREKRRRLIALAARFARRHQLTDRPIRFDVVGVDFLPGQPPTLRHHQGAFTAFR